MKLEWNRRYTTIAVYSFLVIAAAILFMMLLANFGRVTGGLGTMIGWLSPFIYGFVIAYILNPVLNWVENKMFPVIFARQEIKKGTRRVLAIVFTYLFAIFIIYIFFLIVVPQILSSAYNLLSSIPDYVVMLTELTEWIIYRIPTDDLPTEVVTMITGWFDTLVDTIYRVLTTVVPQLILFTRNLTTGVMNLILGIIVSIYMFTSRERFKGQIKKTLYAFLPKKQVESVIRLGHDSHSIFSGFITGKILDSLIIGVICFAVLWLINMPYAMLVSVIIGVTNVIPYFGPFIGAIPSFFIIVLADPFMGLIFLFFILILQQFDGNILGPKILGQSTGLSAFWVIFSIVVFGKLLGFIGMFIGVPAFAVIYSLIRKFVESRLVEKGLSPSTADYGPEQSGELPPQEQEG